MAPLSSPRVIGLTGGIASGKSTVAAMFRQLGAPLIDADVLAREVVEPNTPGLDALAQRFPEVVDVQGRLDRRALAARVFADPQERAALNALLHPRIQARFQDKVRALGEAGAKVVLYDAALLIENRLHETLDGVILVSVPKEVQIERLRARDGLGRSDAEARLDAQLSLAEKQKHATWVIDNAGSLEHTRTQVEALWATLHPST